MISSLKSLANRKALGVLGSVALTTVLMTAEAQSQQRIAHLTLAKVVATPSAAINLCDRYAWACSDLERDDSDVGDLIALSKKVNRQVNRRVRPVDDLAQYRRKDYWALPSRRGGDCEDLALKKKYDLIRFGVSPDRLLIATVISRRVGAHAVLVLRLDSGDFVLDNLNSNVKPWFRTGYTFLRIQNPDDPETWVSVSSKG